MSHFRNILVFQPAAIGDVMFATPVAKTLKANFPSAQITWWTHASTKDLLQLCPYIDTVIDYKRSDGILKQRKIIKQQDYDLVVDLVGSTRAKLLTIFSKTKVLHLKKQSLKSKELKHIVDNLLHTLAPLNLARQAKPFPTLSLNSATNKTLPQQAQTIIKDAQAPGKKLVALVPAVGSIRPNRAWDKNNWKELARKLQAEKKIKLVLVGGKDDLDLCETLAEEIGADCVSLAGRLSLSETAALLRQCAYVVSCDTGPAHIAVACGTPVVGLYGPTYSRRNGPYGFDQYAIDHSSECQCHYAKICKLTKQTGPGRCMQETRVEEVLQKINQITQETKAINT